LRDQRRTNPGEETGSSPQALREVIDLAKADIQDPPLMPERLGSALGSSIAKNAKMFCKTAEVRSKAIS